MFGKNLPNLPMNLTWAAKILQTETDIFNGVAAKNQMAPRTEEILEAINFFERNKKSLSKNDLNIYAQYLEARKKEEDLFKSEYVKPKNTQAINSLLNSGEQLFQKRLEDPTALKDALKQYNQALNIALATQNTAKICEAYIHIGRCYQANTQFDIAEKYYQKALKISPTRKNNMGEGIILFRELVKNLNNQEGEWNVSIRLQSEMSNVKPPPNLPPKTQRMELMDNLSTFVRKNNNFFDAWLKSTQIQAAEKLRNYLKPSSEKLKINFTAKELNALSQEELGNILKNHIRKNAEKMQAILPPALFGKIIQEMRKDSSKITDRKNKK